MCVCVCVCVCVSFFSHFRGWNSKLHRLGSSPRYTADSHPDSFHGNIDRLLSKKEANSKSVINF